jgi:uncharacterized protein YciI
MPDTKPTPQFAIVHSPGPKWRSGVAFMEQPGVGDHAGYYGKLYGEGKVAFGGPFVDASGGGTMVLDPSVSHAEAERLASADPGFRSGLLRYRIRPWLIAFPPRPK